MDKRLRKSILVLSLLFGLSMLTITVEAQTTEQDRANRLRTQLVEVLDKEEGLQTRLLQLEEELKPENIEKSLAGIGSTRPEDLRELRRRQLDLERLSIQNQVNQLAESRRRLEAAIVQADTAAYHQSATENLEKVRQLGSQPQVDSATNTQRPSRTRQGRPRWRRIARPTQE